MSNHFYENQFASMLEFLKELFEAMYDELPVPKPKKKKVKKKEDELT